MSVSKGVVVVVAALLQIVKLFFFKRAFIYFFFLLRRGSAFNAQSFIGDGFRMPNFLMFMYKIIAGKFGAANFAREKLHIDVFQCCRRGSC